MVFDTLGGKDLYKAFLLMKPGGHVISISGSPDHKTAEEMQLGWARSMVLRAVGRKANAHAQRTLSRYNFVFMKPSSVQLAKIATLVDDGFLRPVIDREFAFKDSQRALEYCESGHARGKVVIQIK
mgnify:CR=1 FL=1